MKKVSLILFFLVLGLAGSSFAQTTTTATPADFYAGKWEVAIAGTPMGDVKLVADLVRKDGKLTGDLLNTADAASGKRPITKVDESADKLVLYFNSEQAGELAIELKKVDNDTLKGMLMSFDAAAKRMK
ncbi:hypothetical protein [Fibrivirga algicola]|uniref:Uncharacterized protein n=1 Tax=Fibrivirga algicola TaxID=2950420 RepID=A0ABX0QI71_9BACT|nr:hypothetical protein [Fibrivirga algicola]ARK12674.1 hypothetical protein A6C57_21330 [Fibrella sp. ES10-3-2-2]NID12161.1 hypothetical protein [Fibrivirga algicola]